MDLVAVVEAVMWCLMADERIRTPEAAWQALSLAQNEYADYDGTEKLSGHAEAMRVLLRHASMENIIRAMYQAQDNIEYG